MMSGGPILTDLGIALPLEFIQTIRDRENGTFFDL
jgi:hypothetical protein